MVGVEYGGMLPLQCLLVWTVYLKLQIGSVLSSTILKLEVDKFCLCRNIEYFCFINKLEKRQPRALFLGNYHAVAGFVCV